ncbi:excisionase family protein [Escherichia coli]|jgi:hypothetical protein|nr:MULTISPECIES: excisionase family protein [Enterobacteriaceae]NP_309188.1 phage excisionase [Escherichia coli O157:H7 str. Sakai]YP_007001421.1 excisionase [Escherichia phage TL-2011c]YP_009187908.1 excisionase [Escherichia phage phi191]AEW24507.1 putative excisionase [Escherichia phage TL-2011a]AIF74315.1 excisionase [Escherichia Stx1-converting recombinant phage HUN/2013]AKI85981.1 excisionase [Escherichia phage PA4]AKI86074.1 excisionase [Escherichia phage PA5]AKI86252.1 excisionase [E
MRELVNQHNHGIQPVITPVVQINANEWVTLELLMAVTGLRKGTILRARDSAWMNGREYKQIAPDGTPKKNSECLYHLPTINTWIKNQPLPSQDV